jgi:tetratricopeptide (TPR) repeat protein
MIDMTRLKTLTRFPPVTILLMGVLMPAYADIFDDPQNLEVLPKEITSTALRDTMRSFATSTGSRCWACHVGEDELDLSTYDFSLDDKEKKRKARDMIRMVNAINERLAGIFEKAPDERVTVNCATCHHGQARPETIQAVLARAKQEAGIEKAIADYRSLRERYYGSYTFDFSERALMILAEEMAAKNDSVAALGFLDLNLQFFPQSGNSYVMRGQILAADGNISAARESLMKALEIDPGNQWTQKMLSDLASK